MKRFSVCLCLWTMLFVPIFAQKDSVRVEELLRKAALLPADSCRTLFFAKHLLGIPYVAGTLDMNEQETLVIHLDKADCTTFVETVLALAVADKEGKRDFDSFKQALQKIRYREGKLEGYASRLHYFSDWIADNTRKGIVRERTDELSSDKQLLNLNFMSTHPDSYPQLKNNPELVAAIAGQEKRWQNVSVTYLPKDQLLLSQDRLRIKNGDILAITTHIAGLDVVHTGFACWVGEQLHLLHASSVAKKVILDPQTLYDYSKNKKAHTGVRVISFSF